MTTQRQYDDLAAVLYRAKDGPQDYGRTGFNNAIEDIANGFADVLGPDAKFSRERFIAKCGFRQDPC